MGHLFSPNQRLPRNVQGHRHGNDDAPRPDGAQGHSVEGDPAARASVGPRRAVQNTGTAEKEAARATQTCMLAHEHQRRVHYYCIRATGSDVHMCEIFVTMIRNGSKALWRRI